MKIIDLSLTLFAWPGLVEDIEVDANGLVHAVNGPGLGAAIDFDLIERRKTAVLR